MSQPAIIVDQISKRYRLGHQASPNQTFREMATSMLAAPFRKLRAAGEAGNAGEEFWALKDVNFEVQPGEVVGIIGRNGAGKSTLLKILSRITEPTSGQIRLRGRVASLLEVGTGFHPELTGRENIYLNGAILGMKRVEITQKFDEIVAFAETEKFLDTPVKFYSSGMYVRLAFAVAAHLEPEILIVDEVLAVGDAEFQKKCLGKMKEVSEGGGRTVLFVSHNMAAIRQLCQSAILLRGGSINFAGSTEEAINFYLKPGGPATGSGLIEHQYFSIDRISFDDGHGKPWRTLEKAVLSISIVPKCDIGRLGVRMFLETVDGAPLADLDNYAIRPDIALKEGKRYELSMVLGVLPLRPGDYGIRLAIGDDRHFNRKELSERIPVHVEPSDSPSYNHWSPVIEGRMVVPFDAGVALCD